jgi:hypothetical protein
MGYLITYITGCILYIILAFIHNRMDKHKNKISIDINEALFMSLFSWVSAIYIVMCLFGSVFSKLNGSKLDKWFKGTNK